jgi:hypothetical protein
MELIRRLAGIAPLEAIALDIESQQVLPRTDIQAVRRAFAMMSERGPGQIARWRFSSRDRMAVLKPALNRWHRRPESCCENRRNLLRLRAIGVLISMPSWWPPRGLVDCVELNWRRSTIARARPINPRTIPPEDRRTAFGRGPRKPHHSPSVDTK